MKKKKSWETTLAGFGALLAVVGPQMQYLFDGDPTTLADWNAIVAAVFIFVGLVRARDNNKSSETVEAE